MTIDKQLQPESQPDFEKRGGLIVAIAQDLEGTVLMQAYMNREAWEQTLETGYMVYWSTSRSKLWPKGESSGGVQRVMEIYLDCDRDCALFRVEQQGTGACHELRYSCFREAGIKTIK